MGSEGMRLARVIPLQVLALTLCAGCIPYRFTDRPAASGIVVDAITRTPIAGAGVEVTAVRAGTQSGKGESGADGSFSIPAKKKWGFLPLIGDIFPNAFILTLQSGGYYSLTIEFAQHPGGAGATNFGTLQMKTVAR